MSEKNFHQHQHDISSAVINRLPRYYRYLRDLLDSGVQRINSAELSRIMGVTASQIRQDFNCFGGFGQQGYGYNIANLYENIGELLGVREGNTAIIVGCGNLGRALAPSRVFSKRGVTLEALFDISPHIVGGSCGGLVVKDMSELESYCNSYKPKIAVLCVPRFAAEETARRLVDAGIVGIWNFTNVEFTKEELGVPVENVHLGDTLMTLCYSLREEKEEEEKNA